MINSIAVVFCYICIIYVYYVYMREISKFWAGFSKTKLNKLVAACTPVYTETRVGPGIRTRNIEYSFKRWKTS